MVESHHDWSSLVDKKQPNLDNLFLKTICDDLDRWFDKLVHNFPDLVRQMELQTEGIASN